MNGTARSIALALLGSLALLGAEAAAAEPPQAPFHYVRKETREASRAATLAQYTTQLAPGNWSVIGPFDNRGMDKYAVVYPPELNQDLAATWTGRDGRTVRWETIEDSGWSKIDLKRFGTEADDTDAIAYLYREFDAAEAGEVEFEAGSDDGLELWVNGRVIIDADVYRGFSLQDHLVKVPVRQGRNTILAKVTQGVGEWEFQMRPRVDSRILALLDYHLNRDFPASPVYAHYRPLSILEPEGVVLEVGGLDVMPDGRPIVATRRGEVWIVDGAYEDPPFGATFKRFAFGLHEPLGAVWHDGGLLCVQRGELTKLIDRDGDDVADVYRTISEGWGVSGNYHEFAFGPEFDGKGRMWVTLNVGFCGSLGKSLVPWRGWAIIVNEDGSITPVCGGLRSPNGLGRDAAGEMFCCDNQGDWVATNKMIHLEPGAWNGHPAGNRWYARAGMRTPAGEKDFSPPAIWFPYDRMGRSASDILLDDTGGKFGPYGGQLFVGDQYAASVMRVYLERIDGVYQGACFPFIQGLDCGVNRLCWGKDGSLLVGMTNRGWWSFGTRPWGLQRIVYTGLEPFDPLEIRVEPDGFELVFTERIDSAAGSDPASCRVASFTYPHWEKYGAPEIDRRVHAVVSAVPGPDGRSVRLVLDEMRPRYVYEFELDGIRSADGRKLLHSEAFYTLNVVPEKAR